MAKKWSDVAGTSAFQALSLEEQEEARNQYFESVIAPQVPQEDLPVVRDQFLATTSLPKAPAPQPGKRDTVQNPLNPAKDDRGIIQRVADYLKPAPKSVMDGYKPTSEQQQADVDRACLMVLALFLPIRQPKQTWFAVAWQRATTLSFSVQPKAWSASRHQALVSW
jgi:hypothetical protein